MVLGQKILLLMLFVVAGVLLLSTAVSANHVPSDGCPQYSTNATCMANNCFFSSDQWGSWCEDLSCYDADGDKGLCYGLNKSSNGTIANGSYQSRQFNVSYTCGWEIFSTGLCDPIGGDNFGDGCPDFDNDEQGCYQTGFCFYNQSNNECNEPAGGFGGQVGFNNNPSCAVLTNEAPCTNISGCTWSSNACSGNPEGIQCSDLNKTLCTDFTLLSTCCSWNGTGCATSFQSSCYDQQADLQDGEQFCEDTIPFKNQTSCEKIAGSPWYMPCIFNKSGEEECHFNSAAFGDFASFDEVTTQQGCEAQGGVWKTEQYTQNGYTKTDSWCEFNFGSGGNCDSACWACENGVTAANAEATCEDSDLGYCEFRSDSNALNGIGWCNPKSLFIQGGGKSCDDECNACDFLNEPEAACVGSLKQCVWVNDSSAANGVGNCYGQSEKRCSNDCFSCYTQSDCANNGKGGDGACSWDATNFFCKTTGFTGEICFDGIDNDNDANVDCADSGCATDKFCGGEALSDILGNCPGQQTENACDSSGCVWINESLGGGFGGEFSGYCDFPGAQCWQHDENSTACDLESGCSYLTSGTGFCEENFTLFDNCFNQINQANCEGIGGGACSWINESFGGMSFGRCEPVIFAQCFNNQTRRSNETNCEQNVTVNSQSTQICNWQSFGGGHSGCEPVCFTVTDNNTCSNYNGLCQLVYGLCEPDSFGGNCFEADGNKTRCNGAFNQTCSWFPDGVLANNVSGTNCTHPVTGAVDSCGFCDPKGEGGFVNFLGTVEPTTIGVDAGSSSGLGIVGQGDLANVSYDLQEVLLRDDFDKMVFGSRIQGNLLKGGICRNVPLSTSGLGAGNENHTFWWYLDTDGNRTNGCAARDNSSEVGYEFSFIYKGQYAASLTETKVSYRCINAAWGATPIPLSSSKEKMCSLIGGGMVGIEKNEFSKFKSLFNKSKDLRVYATVGNSTTNDSVIQDSAGPFFYSPGSIDFQFEDCSDTGADADGDGLTSSNDPDCFDFLKFGYVPNEAGFECNDEEDNDADGSTDCSDPGCSFSIECGGKGVPQVDTTDKTAPKITWLEVNTFPDSALIMYDTNEPANGTLAFYGNDTKCKTINGSAIRDIGIIDSFLPDYKMWHDGPIDNFAYNPERSSNYTLKNGTTYYYKTTVCDVNDNCAVSACSNFTTKATGDDCKSCSSTFNFPFTPPSGAAASDPLGALNFTIVTSGGTETALGANAAAGTQLNYTQSKNFDLVIENKGSDASNWSVRLVNASVVGKLSSGITNFSSSDGDISHNSTLNGTFVGLGTTKCQELINAFRPKKLQLGIPGNVSSLYQCGSGLLNCTLKSVGTNATNLGYNTTTNVTTWEVPAEWGC
ncbi:MAG TPA: hypothetical protein VJI15_01170 [Candidatus Nanoarchaeia archaeon]|nr:hypothetical protein [Candidatus Nanoarchaeia archaeon]